MEPLMDEELQSFEDYAKGAVEPDGAQIQWADYTLRLIEEVRNHRKVLLGNKTIEGGNLGKH